MRFAVVVLFVIITATMALANPAKSNPQNACTRVCPANYDPICGKAKNGSKERLLTFGSECVLNNYNCEHSADPYVKKAGGECGNNVSVRLQ